MLPSPVQFAGSRFERIEFSGDVTAQNRVMPGIRYAVATKPQDGSDNRKWSSSLRIELFDLGTPGSTPACVGLFVISGQFNVLLPDEEMSIAPEVIAANAPSMLYSSVRELAYALAVRIGLFGFILPTVYFKSLHAEGVFGAETEQPELPHAGPA